MNKKIGIIGYGNMGSAIAQRLKADYQVFVFDKDKSKTEKSGVNIAANAVDLVNKSDVIILAVKPQDIESLLNEIKGFVNDKLVISIAAGKETNFIEGILGEVKVVRVMPNMPAKIGQGMTCLCKGRFATDDDLNFAEALFDKLGETLILENERMMFTATAVVGSGPAYVAFFMQREKIDINNAVAIENFKNIFFPVLVDTGTAIGFSQTQADLFATATTAGTIALMKAEGLSPQQLQKQVASPGGTTEAALKVLEDGGSLEDAVKAAAKRAEELSK